MGRLTTDLIVINHESKIVSTSYDNFVNDLRGELAMSVSSKNPALVSVRRKFITSATQRANKRLDEYKAQLILATDEILHRALDAALTPEEKSVFLGDNEAQLNDYVNESMDSVVMSIVNLSRGDIKYGGDHLKSIAFDVMTTMVNAGIANAIKGAIVRSVIAGANYTGRSGKVWRSITAARAVTRQHLLTIFNEVTIFAGVKMGDTEFVIQSFSNTNPLNNKVVTVEEYANIKSKAFHPNANALIYRKISQ